MNATGTTHNNLRFDVLTIKRLGLNQDLPTGKEDLMWVANSSTLIYGERDTAFVEVFLTTEESQALWDWVAAEHELSENDDDPRVIAEMQQYLRDFNRLNATTADAQQLYEAMLDIYPDRVNPDLLWGAASAAKEQA